MPRVERVGVLVHLTSPDQYRERLQTWSDEARAAGDTSEVLSAADIEKEVTSREGYSDFDLRLFAVLTDGTQVATDGGSWGFSTGGGGTFVGDERAGPGPPANRLAPSLDAAEAYVRDYIALSEAHRRWIPLLRRLRAAGVEVASRDLDALPLSVELTESTRNRLAT